MGPYLSEPIRTKDTTSSQNSKFAYARAGMQGWRNNMEDADIAELDIGVQDVSIFGVFDGHGGSEVAKFVKNHFVEQLKLNEHFKAKDYKSALEETFMKMDTMLFSVEGRRDLHKIRNPNLQIESTAEVDADDCPAGCTANVVLIHENTLYVANSGDSRCVVGQNGRAIELSVDHKPDNEIEKNRILQAGGYVADGRVNSNLNLSRAIGDLDYKKNKELPADKQLIIAFPDVVIRKIDPEFDFLIIGCDGVWERKTNQENVTYVTEGIKKKQSLAQILEGLLDELLAPSTSSGQGLDNMSMIIVQFIR